AEKNSGYLQPLKQCYLHHVDLSLETNYYKSNCKGEQSWQVGVHKAAPKRAWDNFRSTIGVHRHKKASTSRIIPAHRW
ncbi:MAG TPA: hypothetical protein VJ761_15965, partial [Ktedonobacteraceae bacterium]|nr:hypothetical protein [Ktedonobacteraceae bacterium]